MTSRFATWLASAICLCAVFDAHAQDAPPKDCFFDCKEQYLFLRSYTDHTSSDAIKAAFGEPTNKAKGRKYDITKYEGSVGEFFVLKSALSNKVLGVALLAKADAAKARIPFLHLGQGDPNLADTYRTFSTLKDITLDFAIESCQGTVDDIGGGGWVGGQMRIFWTPKCYFGNPGTYMNYSFLFDVPDCEPYIPLPLKKEFRKPSEDKGAFTMAQLKGDPYQCGGLKTTAKGAFVTHDNSDPSALGPIISNFAQENMIE